MEKIDEWLSLPMVWEPVHSAWNHEALISPWKGPGLALPASFGGRSVISFWTKGSRPVLPARPGLAPRPTTEFFPKKKVAMSTLD